MTPLLRLLIAATVGVSLTLALPGMPAHADETGPTVNWTGGVYVGDYGN